MAREQPSSIDRLPEAIRAEIGRLRVQGRTIDEILAHIKTMDVEVSRSALGRHVKAQAALRERLKHSREMAMALVDRFGEQPDNQLQRLNIEMLHGIVLQTMAATEEDDDGEARPVTFSPEDAKFLAQALAQLASAQKTDTDRQLKLRAEIAKAAAGKAEEAMKARGMSADTIDAIKHAVLGVAT